MKKTKNIKVTNRKTERNRMKLLQGNNRIKEGWKEKLYHERAKGLKKAALAGLDKLYKTLNFSKGGVRERLLSKLNRNY